MGSARQAVTSAFEINLRSLAPVTGVVTAIPVVALFALGMAAHNPRVAISLAVGANLVAVVSLVASPKLSLRLALLDAVGLGLSVFVGTLTSAQPWLHTLLLVPLCFVAGMAMIFGQTQAVLGTQALVVYLVLGRFTGPPLTALHLGLLVTTGAIVEVAALLVLRLPPTLRYQRNTVAHALENLAVYASTPAEETALGVLASLDAAQQVLSPLSLFGRSDDRDLRAIVDQARRARLEFTTLAGLRSRLAVSEPTFLRDVHHALVAVAEGMAQLASSVRRPGRPSAWRARATDLQEVVETLQRRLDAGTFEPDTATLMAQVLAHLEALGGQLRSIGHLAEREGTASGRGAWRLDVRWSGLRVPHWADELDVVRNNLRRDSVAFRHAVRLTIAVLASTGLVHWLNLPRGYWVPFTVALVLKPDYATLLRSGVGRIIGTALGASLAAILVSELHPSAGLTTVLVGVVAAAAYTTWPASFSVTTGFITAFVLILLSVSTVNPAGTALDRFVDVILGGLISALAYLVWPSSPSGDVRQAQSSLFSALAHYVDEVVRHVVGEEFDAQEISSASRAAHLRFAEADAAVGRSLGEPAATRGDPQIERGLLTNGLRILRTTHALRFEAERGATLASAPALEELRRTLVAALDQVGHEDASFEPAAARAAFRAARGAMTAPGVAASIALNLDDLVNAVNTAAHLVQN